MVQFAGPPDQIYSIGQVNALTGIPKPTIRFWEKEFSDFLSPLRTEGNQRRYDRHTVEVLENIRRLVHEEGFTLEGARRKLEVQYGKVKDVVVNGSAPEHTEPETGLDKLAETMSDYLLRKFFQKANERTGGP